MTNFSIPKTYCQAFSDKFIKKVFTYISALQPVNQNVCEIFFEMDWIYNEIIGYRGQYVIYSAKRYIGLHLLYIAQGDILYIMKEKY